MSHKRATSRLNMSSAIRDYMFVGLWYLEYICAYANTKVTRHEEDKNAANSCNFSYVYLLRYRSADKMNTWVLNYIVFSRFRSTCVFSFARLYEYVRSIVCSLVLPSVALVKFTLTFLKWCTIVYLSNHLPESIHIWTTATL